MSRENQPSDREVAQPAALAEEGREILTQWMLPLHRTAVDAGVGEITRPPKSSRTTPDRPDAERAQALLRHHHAEPVCYRGELDETRRPTRVGHEHSHDRPDLIPATPARARQGEEMNRHERGSRRAAAGIDGGWRRHWGSSAGSRLLAPSRAEVEVRHAEL